MNRFLHCLLLSALFLLQDRANGQGIRSFNNNVHPVLSAQGNSHSLFKAQFIFGFKKGGSLGLSYGMWKEAPSLQYSLNTGIQWRFGKRFLGNYRDGANPTDNRSKSQLVFMLSPMLTANLGGGDYIYQEIEPFYLGTPNAVFSKYKYSVTLGTTFTTSPRGTYRNVSTLRNRTQQCFAFALNLKNFNFTLYDDYFPVATTWLQLGDNWDRFFTGGGFLRYRFSDEITLHVYSEVYTGVTRANAFLKPDVISYRYKSPRWKRKNYANQDPGQEYFNSSWFIAKITYTGPQTAGAQPGSYPPNFDLFLGTSAPWTMFSQNLIHSAIPADEKNNLKLHYFLNRSSVPGNLGAGGRNAFQLNIRSLFLGFGFHTNIATP